MTTVSEKLKSHLIIKPNKSITEVAKQLNIGRSALSNMINGKSDLSIELALRIEVVFDLDAREMLMAQLDEKLTKAKEMLIAQLVKSLLKQRNI